MIDDLHGALPDAPGWWRYALCRGVGCDLMFPERGEPTAPARAMCRACSARPACIADSAGQRFGIWGGLSERERRMLRRTGEVTQTSGDVVMVDVLDGRVDVLVIRGDEPALDPDTARRQALDYSRHLSVKRENRDADRLSA